MDQAALPVPVLVGLHFIEVGVVENGFVHAPFRDSNARFSIPDFETAI